MGGGECTAALGEGGVSGVADKDVNVMAGTATAPRPAHQVQLPARDTRHLGHGLGDNLHMRGNGNNTTGLPWKAYYSLT